MGIGFKIYKKILDRIYEGGSINNKFVSKVGRKIHSSIKPTHIEKFGFKLFLDYQDQLMLSVKEYPIHPVLKKIIKSGDNVIDVGANIGVLTLYFRSLIGDSGKIYSFEPDPNSFCILEKNIVQNYLENVIIENKAVSNKNMIIGFEVNKNITGGRIKENDDQMLKVDCVTLDNYFSEKLTKIDFVKIDTEGFDWTVLEGMKDIIKSNPEIKLMVEFHSRLLKESGMIPRKFLKIIEDLNFKIYDLGGLSDKFEFLEGQRLETFAKNPVESTNLLCIHNKINFKMY
jgi:FkbM family methyltransferase